MSLRGFLRQCAMQFFIITTCVTLATAIMGPVFMPGRLFGFNAFYSPLLAGFLGTLPSLVLYSRKELDLKRTILRKALHLLVLEAILTGFAWLNGNITDAPKALLFILMVLAVYLAVQLIRFGLEGREAKRINAGLKALQDRG